MDIVFSFSGSWIISVKRIKIIYKKERSTAVFLNFVYRNGNIATLKLLYLMKYLILKKFLVFFIITGT